MIDKAYPSNFAYMFIIIILNTHILEAMRKQSLAQLIQTADVQSVLHYLHESSSNPIQLGEFKRAFKKAIAHNLQTLPAFFLCSNFTLCEKTVHASSQKAVQTYRDQNYSGTHIAFLLWKICEKSKKESCLPDHVKNTALSHLAISDIRYPNIHRMFQYGARLKPQLSLQQACIKRDDVAIKLGLAEKFITAHAYNNLDEKYRNLSDDLNALVHINKGITTNGNLPDFFVKNYPYSLFWQLVAEAKSLDLVLLNTNYHEQFTELFDQYLKEDILYEDFESAYQRILSSFKKSTRECFKKAFTNQLLYEYLSRAVKSNHRSEAGLVADVLKERQALNLSDSITDYRSRKTIFDKALESRQINAYIVFDLLLAFYDLLEKALNLPQARNLMLYVRKNLDLYSDICTIDSHYHGKILNKKNQEMILKKLLCIRKKRDFSDCIITYK